MRCYDDLILAYLWMIGLCGVFAVLAFVADYLEGKMK